MKRHVQSYVKDVVEGVYTVWDYVKRWIEEGWVVALCILAAVLVFMLPLSR